MERKGNRETMTPQTFYVIGFHPYGNGRCPIALSEPSRVRQIEAATVEGALIRAEYDYGFYCKKCGNHYGCFAVS